jgi:hypothetical protein
MRIEAFTLGKIFATPETNEDRLIILPGRAFAVIDGVTDRNGSRYDGMLSGRYAALTVQAALEQHLADPACDPDDPAAIIAAAAAALQGAYRKQGLELQARLNPNLRIACTLSLVTLHKDHALLLLVGDSGIRLNGSTLYQEDKDLDRITARLRQTAWRHLAPLAADVEDREALARLVTFNGTLHASEKSGGRLSSDLMAAIEADAIAANVAALPHIPPVDITHLIRGGIIHAQSDYLNNPDSPLGYSTLDGFTIADGLYRVERVPLDGLKTIELFTDGYFAPGDAVGVDSWEAKFAEIERLDPLKLEGWPSVKGTTATEFADDRTYLAVTL